MLRRSELRLKKDEDRRLRAGHLWVFANEIDVAATPLDGFEPGAPVLIVSHGGTPLGTGYVNPHSLIAARLCSRDRERPWGPQLIAERLRLALELRERLFPTPYYRLAYGESDGLPGLTVDRFGDVLVVQVTTAGVERFVEQVVAALVKLTAARAVWLRNDTAVRDLEGLARASYAGHGELPDTLRVEEGELRFAIPAAAAQKTGWFYDQRDNRAGLTRWASGARVLDLFAYAGAWGLTAAAAGAAEVLCVDASSAAVGAVRGNATANRLPVEVEQADAFDALGRLHEAGRRFDVVVVDPPALVKRRKDLRHGRDAYHRLNRAALALLEPGGLLVSSSCSHHLDEAMLIDVVRREAIAARRTLQIVAVGGQGADHPVHPAMPETRYLTCLYGRVTAAGY
ncbi:MAG TPA: class I SAM-dependent rRNA methyltransferase [Candidatus Polarisedimenticolaceae bacterium]|nr:class I SAM-dependent rRNA methyltransferase [Candidatus Polarisedimenticolaceae bacterium]